MSSHTSFALNLNSYSGQVGNVHENEIKTKRYKRELLYSTLKIQLLKSQRKGSFTLHELKWTEQTDLL